MEAHIFNPSKLVAALLALAAAVVAVLVIAALSDSGAGSVQAPSIDPAARALPTPSNALAPGAPITTIRKRTTRRVTIQSGRSAKGRSVTSKGAPGESAKGQAGSSAKGGDGGSASAQGGTATSGSVEIQTTEP